MSALPEAVARWVRLQQELGGDEVILDQVYRLPKATETPVNSASASRSATALPQPTEPRTTSFANRSNPPETRAVPNTQRAPNQAVPEFPKATPRPVEKVVAPPTSAPPVPPPTRRTPAAIPTFANRTEIVEHAKSCSRCILFGQRSGCVPVGGEETSSWAILTLYGWGDDVAEQSLLAGQYARDFMELVRKVGLPAPTILSVLACVPTNPADTTIQGHLEAVRCKSHWSQGLRLSSAKAVLVLDAKATQLSRGPSAPVEWPAFRGRPWILENRPAVSTHHPARLARQPQLASEVESDLQQILSILENPA